MPELKPARISTPVQRYMDRLAPDLLRHRWFKSRATRWDHAMTRRSLLKALAPCPDDRILEIGCGPGTWTREVAARCGQMVAVELSAPMIAEAKQQVQDLAVDFIHSDFLEAHPVGKFDKVFSVRAIEYIPDKERLASKIAGLLAPKGRVVLITKSRFSLWRGRHRLIHARGPHLTGGNGADTGPHQGDRERFFQSFTSPGDVSRMFKPHGIVPIQVRPVVLRPPVFKDGFDEIPLIPNTLAPPILTVLKYLCIAASRIPSWLAFFPLLFSESYCITLVSVGNAKPVTYPGYY